MNLFCPKCGSLLIPKKSDKRKILVCSNPNCDYTEKINNENTIQEKIEHKKEIEVIDMNFDENLPVTEIECEKCGNNKAYYWSVQTRAADEPETRFYKCTKCGHVWREY